MTSTKISIVGTVGIPANYGGFETLAENIVKYHDAEQLAGQITVYCSSKSYPERQANFLSAKLEYVSLNANGAQSIPYDVVSLFRAIWRRTDVILLLGVSGAFALPLVRLFSSAKIITNIDGIEWRRQKWNGLARRFLRFSEKMAVRFSHEVISDNAAIASYVKTAYGVESQVIAYGGDHAIAVDPVSVDGMDFPANYAFSVCRIEPENNVHVILEGFSRLNTFNLVIVGNWDNSEYGRKLREQYANKDNFRLLSPIYDLGILKSMRARSSLYIHGHSAGGTNPSLVEAMHFGIPVLAFDCDFNRNTTEDKARYFDTAAALVQAVLTMSPSEGKRIAIDMLDIARRRYTWRVVARQYFEQFNTRA